MAYTRGFWVSGEVRGVRAHGPRAVEARNMPLNEALPCRRKEGLPSSQDGLTKTSKNYEKNYEKTNWRKMNKF